MYLGKARYRDVRSDTARQRLPAMSGDHDTVAQTRPARGLCAMAGVVLGKPSASGHTAAMRYLVLLVLLLSGVAGTAAADQNDERLDMLFARLHATGDEQEAQAITTQIWEIWYHIDDPKARDILLRGVEHMQEGRFDEALAAFDKLVALTPGFAEAWNRRATVLYLMDELAASVDDIKHTLVLEPRHFGALSGLGLIYLKSEQWDDAISAFRKALEVNPHLPGPKLNIELIEQHTRGSTI
ncbi:MAG: tetratricopeptide repeat protein [Gammaproteobacteria bacterium]|nr:tetratricopeptide repeat protein [Gammaproteobacteria bacterium]